MKKTFFGRYALPILLVVFFLLPFGLRGARIALQNMKNNVKDWLPDSFTETKEMEWFWRHFIGERFIVVSWDGCEAGDQSYKMFRSKLVPELPPSKRPPLDATIGDTDSEQAVADAGEQQQPAVDDERRSAQGHRLERPFEFIGDKLQLYFTGDDGLNWGGLNEKWLQGRKGQWYYLTPDGKLYFWKGGNTPAVTALNGLWRRLFGGTISGDLITEFSPEDGPWYYKNPRRLNAQLFKTVTSGPDAYADLVGPGGVLQDDPAEAKRRLQGLLFGPDGKQTCFILTLTPAGLDDVHRVVGRGVLGRPQGRLYTVAKECGIDYEDLHIGGPPVDNVAIDEEGSITLVRLVSVSVLLGLGLAYACFRSISATIIVFFVGGISAVWSVALVGWSGAGVDAVLMSMPSLLYVLGISGAVHLINYYQDALDESGPVGATEKAVKHGWKPAVFCNTTTAIGLISLATSQIIPIKKFGIFSGIAVMAMSILLFTYLPAALEIWPQPPRHKRRPEGAEPRWYEKILDRFWHLFGSFIIRNHYAVAGLCILIIAGVGYGVTKINTSVDLLKLFDKNAKILGDYAWLEEHLGKLVPMEVVIRFPQDVLAAPIPTDEDEPVPEIKPTQLSFLERMEIVDHVQQVIDDEFGPQGQDIAGKSVSAVTFSTKIPPPGNFAAFAQRGALDQRLQAHRQEFLSSEYLRLDDKDKAELWRISVRIGALQNVDYGLFVSELQGAVEPVIKAEQFRQQVLTKLADMHRDQGYGGAQVCLIGLPPGVFEQAVENTEDVETTAATEEASGGQETARTPADKEQSKGKQHVDQTKIFATALFNMLKAARLNVDYHSPQELELSTEELANTLDDYDVVVLVNADASYDMKVVKAHSKAFVNATKHKFIPTVYKMPWYVAVGSAIGITSGTGPQAPSKVHSADTSAIYTGVVPIVYKAQRTLLNSLMNSTFLSFISITPIMMIVCRSIRAGAVSMLPNALPILVIFGAMGWMGIAVDIGSMMTASIALGVAVDDTIHFLTWFKESLATTHDRREAILATYKRCATPTFQAAMISGLGLSIFAFSTFTPTQRFGYLMLTILLCGVAAELIFFPALLAGPLGSVFKAAGKKKHTPEPQEPEAAHAARPHYLPHAPGAGQEGSGTGVRGSKRDT